MSTDVENRGVLGTSDAGVPELFAAPRTKRRIGKRSRTNFELYSWLFMRMSGILLVILVFGHLLIMNVLDGGVNRLNFGFVAGRWASPFWQIWDFLQLVLAELHGTNGMRTIINDYSKNDSTRFWLKMLLYLSAVIVLGLGTLVIFSFNPNIGD